MSIEIRNVSKKYGGVQALQNVSLTLEENKIYGLLGSNGAGKSTLI
ncbi:MAG: ATP-binding cassette domain-containing protein, partial [Oscillospiraceae bacterium]|nr:ATP-binding cassette domain-containing protein [Oscillospiraceae bacterium]